MGKFFLKPFFTPIVYVQNDQRALGIILRYICWGTPPPPPGTPAADQPTHLAPSRLPKVFAPDWVSRVEQATPPCLRASTAPLPRPYCAPTMPLPRPYHASAVPLLRLYYPTTTILHGLHCPGGRNSDRQCQRDRRVGLGSLGSIKGKQAERPGMCPEAFIAKHGHLLPGAYLPSRGG